MLTHNLKVIKQKKIKSEITTLKFSQYSIISFDSSFNIPIYINGKR